MSNDNKTNDAKFGVEYNKGEEHNKTANYGERAAYAAGGVVVGSGATIVGQASARTITNDQAAHIEEDKVEDVVVDVCAEEVYSTSEQHNDTEQAQNMDVPSEHMAAPAPEETIVATATGIRVAQVDDNASFSQAFADARAQVGPGGVFEWYGRAYSTYYKNEWDQMTPAERHDFQASIDYNDVLTDDSMAHHHNAVAHQNIHNAEQHVQSHTYQSSQDNSLSDSEVRVIAVDRVDANNDGYLEDVAVVEVQGNRVILVDVDNDGVADVGLADLNGNGVLDNGEVADISTAGIQMPTQSDSDVYFAQADADNPDYINDANVGLYES